jgi:very-short-patch-repair endonuclease
VTFDRIQMTKVAKSWQSAVVDFTKRNNLLFFKSKSVTLDLAKAQASELNLLLAGLSASLKNLVTNDALEESQKVAVKLLAKQKYLLEELGVSPIFVAIGFCSWIESEATGSTPEEKTTFAPIYLLQIELENKRSSQEGWKLKPTSELKVNGVISHAAMAAGIKFDEDDFIAALPEAPTISDLIDSLPELEKQLTKLDEFTTSAELHLAAFGYQDEAIYRDLLDIEGLMESEIVRALAGDSSAITKLQRDPGIDPSAPDYAEPELENLILDADSSQIQTINSVMAGHTVVVEGPPGTGKSQTIANLLAETLAQGKKVLFVAQKRAAITAVLARLEAKGLSSLVLDLHEAHRGPQVAAQLASSYENMRSAQLVESKIVHGELKESRDQLVELKDAFTIEQRGLGLTLSGLQNLYYETDDKHRPDWRIETTKLSELDEDDFRDACKAIRQAGDAQAFKANFLTREDSWNVKKCTTSEKITQANKDAMEFASKQLKALLKLPLKASEKVSVRDFHALAASYVSSCWVNENTPKLVDKTFTDEEVEIALSAFGGKDGSFSWASRMQVKFKTVFVIRGDSELKLDAFKNLKRIRKTGGDLRAIEIDRLPESIETLNSYLDNLRGLMNKVQGIDFAEVSVATFAKHVTSLAKDTSQYRIAKYWEAERILKGLGLEDALEELHNEALIQDLTSDEAELIFKAACSMSLIEEALMKDERLQGFDSEALDRVTRSFQKAERAHLKQNASRILRLAAENFQKAISNHQEEHQFLQNEAAKKRAHKPLRELLRRAPNLMIAANPVWAMSPIQVASQLPRAKYFDVVIFDEASQIRPEMAIPAIMRGEVAVIAGDSNQLPPTNFFSGAGLALTDDDDEESRYGIDTSITENTLKDSESILEAMERVVGTRKKRLLWHYRSRDERLIALSNIEIYGNSLTTFPASDTPDALTHVLVGPGKNKVVATGSQNNEAVEVIGLIKQHIKTHPNESLGVISFGIKHLEKIEIALARERQKDKVLDSWLEDPSREVFFLKNLERVQGDERDAIIISTGYGKDENGKMNLRWGPLTSIDGRRRLNVAISRAKRRMTLVSNFTAADLSDLKVREGTGIDLYKKFLDYVSNDGASYQNASSIIPLNSFELDIKRRLEAEGLKLVSQFGVCNYRIDFAIRDPRNPDKFVLAVEADGASYHSGHIARERDRLRQMLLEDRGWNFHRIWSTDWFNNPDREVARVLDAYQSALGGKRAKVDIVEEDEMSDTSAPERTLPHPGYGRGNPITDYSSSQIDAVVRYILSDGLLRSNDEIIEEASKQIFQFAKTGSRIQKILTESINRVKRLSTNGQG